MNIRYLSDLHLEFTDYKPRTLPSIGEDVVVLAGDIGLNVKGIEWAKRAIPDRPVIYVLGNHEFYRRDFNSLIDEALAAAYASNVHFLENGRVDIDGVRFLGATLWTGFDIIPASQKLEAIRACEAALNDFTLIRKGSAYLDVVDTIERHIESRTWPEAEISTSPHPVVVVTHHSPSTANEDPTFLGQLTTAAFHSNCERLFRYPVRLWISGHTHYCSKVSVNKIPLVSNQRGYPGEVEEFDWDAIELIETRQ